MVRVEELRVGNYVYGASDRIEKVCAINSKHKECEVDTENIGILFHNNFNDIFPIPLTEDILLKIEGFKDGKIETDNFIFSIQFYDGWNIYYKEKSNYGDTEYSSVGFPALHELQNLFHSLSGGQELNLKL